MNDYDNFDIAQGFEPPNGRNKKNIVAVASVVAVILLALLVALLLRQFVFSTIPVDGPSMLPTLVGGDYDVDENGTITKVHQKGDTLFLNKIAKIKRGDIIVFNVDGMVSPLVKRVIAVEGDTVVIKDGKVYLNDTLLEEDYVKGQTHAYGHEEFLIVVPSGKVFCLGDNRENSHDSRSSDIGCIPLENIRGKCFLISSADGKLRSPK